MMTEIVAAIADDPLRNAIRAAKVGADIIEIRIDLLDYPADSLHSLFKQLNKSVRIPIIATNRIDVEGGKFEGSEEERIEVLLSVLEMVDAIDIELRTRSEYRDLVVHRAKKEGKRVIISYHDFSETPDIMVMQNIVSECFDAGADIAKLATTPHSYGDALSLLQLTLDCARTRAHAQVCIIGMGGYGVHTRVIAPIYGSALAYTSVGAATATGQIGIQELRGMLEMLCPQV
ncbi:MAG: type I 3-dehydroquinate dehydratase [Euryarchaeota archaeon]|nr:type I 3-dehydroquinate dehydratase [Euryarchaeota archaeon]